MIQDFYAILGVAPDADAGQITHAFRRLARALHPDTPPTASTRAGATASTRAGADSERFTQVVAAWRVLHDPARRAAYDRTRPRTTPTIPDRLASDLHEHHAPERHAPEHHHAPEHRRDDDAVLVVGPTVIQARPVPQPGPVIRAGPPVRLGD